MYILQSLLTRLKLLLNYDNQGSFPLKIVTAQEGVR